VFLAGLPVKDLQARLATLPQHSLVYYLHIFEDGDGKVFAPAEALGLIAAKANCPIFCHVDSYIGRGAVGGRVFSFESAGKNAAELGVRILAGERPGRIGVQPIAENAYLFDWRQLQRWRIPEASLPAGSVVKFKVPTLWEAYKWRLIVLISVCLLQGLMIMGLVVQRTRRGRAERHRLAAEAELRRSQATLRELAGKLLTAEQTERRSIARELHDDLGQGLALLSVELDLLQQKSPVDSSEFNARVAKLSTRIKQLSTSIHELSHQLHPMKLEQLGLVAAVRALCKELSETHDLEIRFLHDDIPSFIPQDIAICLYRVAQEGLQNIVKHSQAHHVGVELHLQGGAICLEINDDGIGFHPNSAATHEGLGLASMRERIRLVNGEIQMNPRGGGGTKITALVPLAEDRTKSA
jgi:signal transduction histidine kinase